MKNFTKMSMVLFDSTNAHFKLSVESTFTKINQAGGVTPLVYVGQTGIANLNPNIYLMFTYKSDTYDKGNFLYTSYPQLYKIREAMEEVKNLITGKDTFLKDENGDLFVKPEYKEPITLTGIGKQNKWLMFTLVVTDSTEDGVSAHIPGVSLQISSANQYASVLTIDEFLTLYTIIKDLNLSNLQAMMSIAFLNNDGTGFVPQMQNNYGQQSYQGYRQQGGYQQPAYQAHSSYRGNNNGYQARSQYHAENNQQGSAPRQQYRAYQQPAAPQQPAPVNNNQNRLPPRAQEKQPVMNFDAINETQISYDDDEAINAIFNNDNSKQ